MPTLPTVTSSTFSFSRLRYRGSALPPLLVPACLVIFLGFGLGPHILIVSCALVVLVIGSALLWRPLEPPILWFVFVFQWIEVFLLTFYANAKGVPLRSVDYFSDPTYATWLAMLGLVSIALGMRVGAGSSDGLQAQSIAQQVNVISQVRLFKLYLLAVVLTLAAPLVIAIVPGLRQPLLVAESLKWAAYVIFTIVSFRQPSTSKGLWFLVFFFELIQSIGGYWSSFKLVFLYTFLGIMTARYRFRPPQIAGVIVLTLSCLLLGVVWSEIKGEYRNFVSGGKREQIVTAGYLERIDKLYELVTELDAKKIESGADKLINRLAYISFFGAATHYIPAVRPHSGGAILWDAISRPFMPRLLFPAKPIIDESKLVRKYTGLRVAGMDDGVQISLGFYGESYVDFGIYGMIFVLFGWGFFWVLLTAGWYETDIPAAFSVMGWRQRRYCLRMVLALAAPNSLEALLPPFWCCIFSIGLSYRVTFHG